MNALLIRAMIALAVIAATVVLGTEHALTSDAVAALLGSIVTGFLVGSHGTAITEAMNGRNGKRPSSRSPSPLPPPGPDDA